jgi:surface carbohydrate biosynthesis protein
MNSVGIFVDSYWRDSLGAVLVKNELEKQGLEVDLVPFSLWSEYLSLVPPSHVVLNHAIGRRNKMIVETVHSYGGTVSVLPTEGRPNTKVQTDWYGQQEDIDFIFHWSKQTLNAMKHVKGKVVGCPRFDPYVLSGIIEDSQVTKAKHGIDNEKKVLLFVTSFPQAKFYTANSEFNKKDWRDLGVPFDPVKVAEDEYKAREKALTLINLVSSYYPQYEIIIRPHPMEDSVWWERGLRRGKIVSQEYIHNLLNIADIVINRKSCTTTMEAWLLKKPIISVSYSDETAEGAAKEIWESSKQASHPTEVFQFISNPDGDDKNRTSLLKKYGMYRPAAKRVAKEIAGFSGTDRIKSYQNLAEWSRVLTEHNDKYVIPVPGFHVGKESARFHLDALSLRFK